VKEEKVAAPTIEAKAEPKVEAPETQKKDEDDGGMIHYAVIGVALAAVAGTMVYKYVLKN